VGVMQAKNLLLIVILILGLSLAVIYFKFMPTIPQTENLPECFIDADTMFNVCYYDSKEDKTLSYGETPKLPQDVSISYSLKANTEFFHLLNISSFVLPSSYHICTNSIRLINSSEDRLDADLVAYDPSTNTEFACVSQLYNDSNHVAFDSGILPCMQDQFPIVEVYIFPASFVGKTITNFKNNINISERIFAAYGVTEC
jgi:hypothetical protein